MDLMSERLSPERAIRLLRAKAHELERTTKVFYAAGTTGYATNEMIGNLAADIALIAGLLADHIEQSPGPWGPEDEDWGDGTGATGGVPR
jgi:hypothetical protein